MLVVCLVTIVAALSLASPPESRLMNDLLSGYVKEERPVLDSSQPVAVSLGVILQQIINLNEKEEQLEVNAWLKFTWRDENLRWDPRQYSNISVLIHPANSIWQPDILLYNSVDPAFDSTFKVNVLSYSDGTLNWMPPGIFRIACKLDIYWFPFDTQTCFFKFGSWSSDASKIDLQVGDFDMSEYMANGEWIIEEFWANRTERFYACCPDAPYQDIKFYLHLKRRTLYYAFNLIMPCMMTMLLIVLGFTLSPHAGEKIGLQITVSLAICIFLTILNGMTPQTSESVPLLGVFFQSCMVISVLATTFTVYVQSFHFRNNADHHRMGFWLRHLLLEWAPWLLGTRLTKRENNLKTIRESWEERKSQRADDETKTAFDYTDATARMIEAMGSAMKENFDSLLFQVEVSGMVKDKQLIERLKLLDCIHKNVKLIREHDDEEEVDRRVSLEWRFAALVVDRLGLFAFSLVLVVTAAVLSLRAPYLFA